MQQTTAITGRNRLVWQLLNDAITTAITTAINTAGTTADTTAAPGVNQPPAVLDCGGGSGSFAVPLAQAGAFVTVVDVSADALATLSRRAAEAGVAELVRPLQADVENLADAVAPHSFDLVLAHGILEAVDNVPAAFEAIVGTVRPGGLLSVLVNNPAASVLARALSGDVQAALAEFRALDSFGVRGPAAVDALARQAGLAVEQVHGVGVFSDLVPGAALDVPGAADALAELEAESSVRSPFAEIAGRVHVLARRPR